MILGTVTAAREAIVKINVPAGNGRVLEIEAVLDTGFNDELTMPLSLIETLGLTFEMPAEATLAHEVTVATNCYRATLIWDGVPRPVSVLEIEGMPLMGMGLIWRCRTTIEANDGGRVTIEPI